MDEKDEWIIYMASLASMSIHPGAGTRGHVALSLEDCANMADKMIQLRALRYPKEQ